MTENLTHDDLMRDPKYAVATHGHQLNKFAEVLEQLTERVLQLEERMTELSFPDVNDPLKDFPEVKQ
jgi:hypothetical protein